jgi:hypothetical protein
MTALQEFERILADCRFCPMCKPAAEVANRKKIEGYSTRSRAMMLWRIAAGQREWTTRGAELLYQSTLDGISEAFCVSDRPVSAYTLAARQDVWAAGLAPEPVRRAVSGLIATTVDEAGEQILVAAECSEAGETQLAASVAGALGLALVARPVGATAYALGASDIATEQARAAAVVLASAKTLVADGPQTQWLLQRIWPELGVVVDAEVVSLPAFALSRPEIGLAGGDLGECYLVDSRAASFLADGLARPVAIQPGYFGAPDDSGQGAVFDDFRALLRRLGGQEQRHRWERSLARSCGADDGLWASYPEIAADLATTYLAMAAERGAQTIVTDSSLSASLLTAVSDGSIPIRWIGELVQDG